MCPFTECVNFNTLNSSTRMLQLLSMHTCLSCPTNPWSSFLIIVTALSTRVNLLFPIYNSKPHIMCPSPRIFLLSTLPTSLPYTALLTLIYCVYQPTVVFLVPRLYSITSCLHSLTFYLPVPSLAFVLPLSSLISPLPCRLIDCSKICQ